MWLLSLFMPLFAQEYALDSYSRQIPSKGKIPCPNIPLETYRGTHYGYTKPIRVHKAFKERLIVFEELVVEVAKEIYGRAPSRIKHSGGYTCKRIGGYPNLLSEHSFGNALDISRFYFDPQKPTEVATDALPAHLKKAFVVQIYSHWNQSKKNGGLHQKFLHTVAKRMIERDLFRVQLGPAFPNHKDHFHLDMAPYRLVSIFD